jgi:hypothetical protein
LNNAAVNVDKVIEAFKLYMIEEGNIVTKKEFIDNMEKKIEDADFLGDMNGLLRSDIKYDIREAYKSVKTEIFEKL